MFKLKKFLLVFPTIVFLLFFVFLTGNLILAQPSLPSFELFSSACGPGKNCTTYPLVASQPVQQFPTSVVITAFALDVSGMSSVVVKIQNPSLPGQFMNIGASSIMHNDGVAPDVSASDNIFSTLVDTSTWPAGTYKVDFSATDNLSQNGYYSALEQFTIAVVSGGTCSDSGGAHLCVIISTSATHP